MYQEMQKNLAYFQSKEQKCEALKLLDLENVHQVFDDLIQRAFLCVSPNSDSGYSTSAAKERASTPLANGSGIRSRDLDSLSASTSSFYSQKQPVNGQLFAKDDSYVKKGKASLYGDGFASPASPQIVDSSLKTASSLGENSLFLFPLNFCSYPASLSRVSLMRKFDWWAFVG